MLNLHSIFIKTVQAIESHDGLKKLQLKMPEIKQGLILELESIVKDVLINLADYYPQAPVTGGTLRMNSAINEVNRVEDEENDLIFSNGLSV